MTYIFFRCIIAKLAIDIVTNLSFGNNLAVAFHNIENMQINGLALQFVHVLFGLVEAVPVDEEGLIRGIGDELDTRAFFYGISKKFVSLPVEVSAGGEGQDGFWCVVVAGNVVF